ncbi:MAG: hypothetical protein LBJ02_04015 [Bifidobacteriaceae bacterium]|nr:hypothetical protein [Bifidobacteriaceae bacterium]
MAASKIAYDPDLLTALGDFLDASADEIGAVKSYVESNCDLRETSGFFLTQFRARYRQPYIDIVEGLGFASDAAWDLGGGVRSVLKIFREVEESIAEEADGITNDCCNCDPDAPDNSGGNYTGGGSVGGGGSVAPAPVATPPPATWVDPEPAPAEAAQTAPSSSVPPEPIAEPVESNESGRHLVGLTIDGEHHEYWVEPVEGDPGFGFSRMINDDGEPGDLILDPPDSFWEEYAESDPLGRSPEELKLAWDNRDEVAIPSLDSEASTTEGGWQLNQPSDLGDGSPATKLRLWDEMILERALEIVRQGGSL